MAESEAPSWIDAAFVQESLRCGGEEDAVVESVTLRPLGVAGDHYASTMFRITAETVAGKRLLIVKVPPPGEMFQKAMRECRTFPTESTLLSEIIPQMHELLEQVAPGEYPPFAAKCLNHGSLPEDFLVIEDLSPHNFCLADRHRGLGLRHSLLALRTLARFHAASVVLLSQDPTIPHRIRSAYRSNDKEFFESFVRISIQQTANACRKWNSSLSEYSDSIDALKNIAFDRYADINDYKPGRFSVINHGDFHVNNLLFRYEDDEVKEIRVVDFQFSHVTTPAVDLHYFLYSSVSEDVLQNHTEMLIREYHVTLAETMNLFGLEGISLASLQQELEENAFYATFAAFLTLPFMKAEKAPDIEGAVAEVESEDTAHMSLSPNVERWLRHIVPQFHAKGLLS